MRIFNPSFGLAAAGPAKVTLQPVNWRPTPLR